MKDTLVITLNDTHPYKAYIEVLLSFGTVRKQSQLTTSMWYKDLFISSGLHGLQFIGN